MSEKLRTLGFGFRPEESLHHFLVCISAKADSNVMIYERFAWQDEVSQQKINVFEDKAKAEISRHKWKLLEDVLKTELQ